MTDEICKLKVENDRLKRQLNEAEFAKNAEFADELVAQGKLAPIVKAQALELLNYATRYDSGETLDFAENESLSQKVQAFLQNQPQVMQFGEIATKERAYDPDTSGENVDYTVRRKGGLFVDTYKEKGGKVEIVRCTDIHKPHLVGKSAGYLIKGGLTLKKK